MRKPNFSAYPASVDGTLALLVTDGGKVAAGACNAGCKNGVQAAEREMRVSKNRAKLIATLYTNATM